MGRKALDWLEEYRVSKDQYEDGVFNPFLMVLATSAPKATGSKPPIPAPQYRNIFLDREAPRTPAFNRFKNRNSDKHWFMRFNSDPLDENLIETIDDWFRNRWRSLLSVDDMIDNVMKKLEDIDELDNTFVLFTSDHGYHLGAFGTKGKRVNYESGKLKNRNINYQLFDFKFISILNCYVSPICNTFLDVRVPFLIRGPGIKKNKTVKEINVNIDIAPTIIEISGHTIEPDDFDGISLLRYVINKKQGDYVKRVNFIQLYIIYRINQEYVHSIILWY